MDVLIVGAGIAGLTLALALRRRGCRPLVVERAPDLRDEGYMIDFVDPGYAAAERLGLRADLEQIHYQIDRLRFLDSGGHEKFSLAYPTLRRRLFAGRHFNFLRGDLERLLHDRVRGAAPVRFGAGVVAIEQEADRVRATFADGTSGAFDLLVGADGAHSTVRALVFGPEERFTRFLGHVTAAFILDGPGLPDVPTDAFSTVTEPGRQVAVYPIRGGRLATFFLHRADRPAARGASAAALAELDRVYGDMGWVVPDLLANGHRAATHYFDAVEQVVVPGWSSERVVLLGDACWCVSLLAGQGASLAMAGADILAQELTAPGASVASAAAHYEARLKSAVEAHQRAGRRIADWFVPASRLRLRVRDLATRASAWPLVAPLLRRQFALGAAKL